MPYALCFTKTRQTNYGFLKSAFVKLSFFLFFISFFLVVPVKAYAATYYVSVADGDDTNCTGLASTAYVSGAAQACPWKTVSKVNSTVFSAGDTISFKKGETWRESLAEPYPGSSGNPITISSYGSSTNKPIISGADVVATSGWNLYTGATYVSDTFDRADQSGWGTADGGGDSSKAWGGGTTDFAISGNKGVFVGAWAFGKKNIVGDSQARDIDITVDISSIPNLDRPVGILTRKMDDNKNYSITYQRDIATFRIDKNTEVNPWVYNLGSSSVGDFSAASMRVKVETTSGAVRIRAKIWSGSEPANWTLDVTEAANTTLGGTWWDPTTSTAHTGPFLSGNFALIGGNAGSGQLAYDNFSAKSITTAVNTYYKTLTTDPGSYILENGNMMTKETSISAVDSTEGSFYWTSNVLYLHPTGSGNPATNGKTYETPIRNILVNVDSSQYLTFDGIQFEMNQGSLLFDANNSDNLTVKNCTFRYSNGYHVWVGDSDKSDSQTFQNNTFTYSVGTGIAIHGDNVSVTGNTFTYSGRAIELRDITGSHSSNFTIDSNDIENMGSSTETNAGILLDGDTNGTNTDAHSGKIRYNLFKTIKGRAIDGFYLNTVIAYNIISGVTDGITNSGMAIEINGGGNTVYNNTLYNIQNTALQIGSDPVVANTGNTIKNNIIYSTGNWVILIGPTVSATQTFNNNIYWPGSSGTSKYYWKGTGYNFTNWKIQSGADTNSSEADPLLVNPPTDFHLQSSSPAINTGVDVGLTTDYAGSSVPQGSAPDMGAYEYISTPTPTATPTPTPIPTPTSTPTTNDSSSSSNSNSSTSTPSCGDATPGNAPWLYGAIPEDGNSVMLNWTDAQDPYNKYVLEYGTKSGNYQYGADNMGGKGTRSYLVSSLSPNTIYYFRVRAGNGCATGPWSNELSTTTKGLVSTNQLEITSSELIPQQTSDNEQTSDNSSNGSCQTYTIKSGDSLWNIASKLLGNGSKYKDIIDQNKNTYPSLETSNTLSIGWELKVNCNGTQTSQPEAQKAAETPAQGGYDVKVKVVDTEKKPVEGATVTMHSTPQTTKTDKSGIALFHNVEQGDHKVLIAYSGFQGEQSINLTGDVKEFNLNVTVKPQSVLLSPIVIGTISALVGVIAVLGFLLMRSKNTIKNISKI